MQSVDLTTLTAACSELRSQWLPARLEQVYQRDRYTISLALRTLKRRGWLDISWHPQAARVCIADPPPRKPDTFTFSDQLRHQLGGLALVALTAVSPWERVLDLQFAKRPGDPVLWHLYVEIMSKYSNVILTETDQLVVTVAHQVSAQQSSVRPIQTSQPYELPPSLTDPIPSLDESYERWQERVSLIPGALSRQLLKNYRGLSSPLLNEMIQAAGLDPNQSTDSLTDEDWKRLFDCWKTWLISLENEKFKPHWTAKGYGVIAWENLSKEAIETSPETVNQLLNIYYNQELNQQLFKQIHHQIRQKLNNLLKKLRQKAAGFQQRLQQSDDADLYRSYADILMASLQQWQPGMKSITLSDFDTGEPIKISLDPEKNAVQNAQAYYKRHQKLKRARVAVEPLLAEVMEEVNYLEQVEAAIEQIETYRQPEDLQTLEEIREELIQQNYLKIAEYRGSSQDAKTEFYHYQTPSKFEVLVGRNNRQNDLLTSKIAGDYDLWFHTQEIPGSHVLLRLNAGEVPEDTDLQFVANLTAYYSRARQSEQVPVIYTRPKYVYKPKGAKPGMVIYKQETVIWGNPQQAEVGQVKD
ncbi:MAG: NFACT RNA binding domain-containing protein [Microcoleaceae cyanobacterium]